MVRRSEFDRALAEVAESCGAEVRFGTRIVSADPRGDHVVLRDSSGGEYRARFVVLATGMREALPLSLGFPPLEKEYMGHCWGTEAPYPVDRQVKRWKEEYGFTPIFLFFGIVTYGYFWVFPKAEHMNVGMGTLLKESARYGKLHTEGYKRGLEEAKRLGVLEDVSGFRVDRGWVLPSRPRKHTYSVEARALVVGDAAGFVHPATGEGISGALKSGMLAARAVKKAADRDDPSLLAEYGRSWREDFGDELFVYGAKLASLLYKSPKLLELGLRAIMEDERAARLLSHVLYRSSPGASKELYEYVVKRLPLLALKSVRVPKVRNYSELETSRQ